MKSFYLATYLTTAAITTLSASGAYAHEDQAKKDISQTSAKLVETQKKQLGLDAHPLNKAKHLAYQKPGAPIRITQPDFIQLDPDTQTTVDISFSTPRSGTLFLSQTPKDGISTDAPQEWEFDLSNGQPRVSFQVTTQSAGQYHVMFEARIDDGDYTSSRVFGVPVYVGEQQEESQSKTYPAIITMEAQETIR